MTTIAEIEALRARYEWLCEQLCPDGAGRLVARIPGRLPDADRDETWDDVIDAARDALATRPTGIAMLRAVSAVRNDVGGR